MKIHVHGTVVCKGLTLPTEQQSKSDILQSACMNHPELINRKEDEQDSLYKAPDSQYLQYKIKNVSPDDYKQ